MSEKELENICLIAQGILRANPTADKHPKELAQCATDIYFAILDCVANYEE